MRNRTRLKTVLSAIVSPQNLSLRIFVYPLNISKSTSFRELENLVHTRVGRILLVSHDDGDVIRSQRCCIPPWTVILVHCHSRVGHDARVCLAPLNVSIGLDGVVKVRVGEDGTM